VCAHVKKKWLWGFGCGIPKNPNKMLGMLLSIFDDDFHKTAHLFSF
jgi:hypothetical protein